MHVSELLSDESIEMSVIALEENLKVASHQIRFHQAEFANHFYCQFEKPSGNTVLRYESLFTVWTEKRRTVRCPGPGEVIDALCQDAIHIHQVGADYRAWTQEFFKSRNPKTEQEFLQAIYLRQLENYKGLQFFFSAPGFIDLVESSVQFDPPGGVNSKQAKHRSDASCAWSWKTSTIAVGREIESEELMIA